MTRIDVIGSKWAGEESDTVENLLALMATEPLDPRFEAYGNFIYLVHEYDGSNEPHPDNGYMHAWGNFYTCSYAFNITTDDLDLIHRFYAAITANQTSAAYRAARETHA